jgi:hypothetical protein
MSRRIFNERESSNRNRIEQLMNTVRTALRRIFGATETTEAADASVHFHRRGVEPEACYDPACKLPRLTV